MDMNLEQTQKAVKDRGSLSYCSCRNQTQIYAAVTKADTTVTEQQPWPVLGLLQRQVRRNHK